MITPPPAGAWIRERAIHRPDRHLNARPDTLRTWHLATGDVTLVVGSVVSRLAAEVRCGKRVRLPDEDTRWWRVDVGSDPQDGRRCGRCLRYGPVVLEVLPMEVRLAA